jgi:DNA adenine methylase
MACKGDLVYMDPPYTVTHEDNNFIEYNARIFTWQDQIRLKDLVFRLTSKGVKVIVSNAAHCAIEELYHDFKIHTVSRSSVLAAKNSARRKINEFIIVNY